MRLVAVRVQDGNDSFYTATYLLSLHSVFRIVEDA